MHKSTFFLFLITIGKDTRCSKKHGNSRSPLLQYLISNHSTYKLGLQYFISSRSMITSNRNYFMQTVKGCQV